MNFLGSKRTIFSRSWEIFIISINLNLLNAEWKSLKHPISVIEITFRYNSVQANSETSDWFMCENIKCRAKIIRN